MPYDYGYIKRTEGADGDHVDVCIGENKSTDQVFIIDQKNINDGSFDEHKVMLGFNTKDDAINHYERGFSDGKGRERIKSIVRLSLPEFKEWLKGDTTKPVRSQSVIDKALSLVAA
jgi:hypothetical protein